MTARWLLDPQDRLLQDRANKAQAELRKLDAQRRREGILPHVLDPADPWSETEWRLCYPGCLIHVRQP